MKCDDGLVGEGSFPRYKFYDAPNFTVKSAQTSTVVIQLCIKIEGNALTFLHKKCRSILMNNSSHKAHRPTVCIQCKPLPEASSHCRNGKCLSHKH